MTRDPHDHADGIAEVTEELALAESSGPREQFAPGDERWRADPGETAWYESELRRLAGALTALAATEPGAGDER